MLKITNSDYFLPKIEALSGDKVFDTGATAPMLIRGVCTNTGIKADYVIKYRNSRRMSNEASARELIASFIAREIDLNVVEPVIINVSALFVETLIGRDGYRTANNSHGLNFGSRYMPGFQEFITNQPLNNTQYEQAKMIFGFDVFIANADRRVGKQNMLTNGHDIIIFDHELAFGFIMDVIKNPKPWMITNGDVSWIKGHYFYNILRQGEHNLDEFVKSFEVINDDFWKAAIKLLPDEWMTKEIQEIKSNLDGLILNKEQFLEELYSVLS